LEIHDRTAGVTLPIHWHHGRAYVEGQPGNEYSVSVRNRNGEDLLAVISVDGINVVTGETASPQQSGYVIDAWQSLDVSGWRKSLSHTAAFYFTSVSDSYAGRTGRPQHTGVIGVALYRRKAEEISQYDGAWWRWRNENHAPKSQPQRDAEAAPASPAPSAKGEADAGLNTRSHDAPRSDAAPSERQRLGTGHGRNEHNAARRVTFERATAYPEETLTIYYDSRANLIARGIIREPRWPRYAPHAPQAFPGGFVPDPPRWR
jgi:hypothetical protein